MKNGKSQGTELEGTGGIILSSGEKISGNRKGGKISGFFPEIIHDQTGKGLYLFFRQGSAFGDVMIFLQTGAAAAGCGMLGFENHMAPHGGLGAVVIREGLGDPFRKDMDGLGVDDLKTFGGNVSSFRFCQKKTGPEGRFPDPVPQYGIRNDCHRQKIYAKCSTII